MHKCVISSAIFSFFDCAIALINTTSRIVIDIAILSNNLYLFGIMATSWVSSHEKKDTAYEPLGHALKMQESGERCECVANQADDHAQAYDHILSLVRYSHTHVPKLS